MPVTFTLTGRARGQTAVLTWTEDGGFDDPDGIIAELLALDTLVCATVTGPCYPAAETPAVVAWLTAVEALDEITGIEDPNGVQAMVETEAEVPAGAVS